MGCAVPVPGSFIYTGMPLWALPVKAYGVKSHRISGQAWLQFERSDIVVKVSAGAAPEQIDLMLESFLEDRFRMRVHGETKALPVFALMVGKNGPDLKVSPKAGKQPPIHAAFAGRGLPPPPNPPGGGSGHLGMTLIRSRARAKSGALMTTRNGPIGIAGSQATLSSPAGTLSAQLIRPVSDQTGLKGDNDFILDFAAGRTVHPE